MIKPLSLTFLLAILLLACGPTSSPEKEEAEANSLDWEALSTRLLAQAQLTEGEKVLLLAEPGRFDSLVVFLADGIRETGAEYLGTFSNTEEQPVDWKTEFTEAGSNLNAEALKVHLQSADLGIMMPGPSPDNLIYGLIQDNLREGIGRTIHFHWSGAYDLNGKPLAMTPEIDALYQQVVLETDYEQLARDQRAFQSAAREKRVTVTTPAGTHVSFLIGDRPVTKQDGNASQAHMDKARNLIDREIEIPAGAIRVAPIEESVEGIIVFPDAEWDGEAVTGLQLSFRAGKVVEMQAASGLEAVQSEMEKAGEAGKSFREFALGFNPLLAIPDENPHIPYYGYGSGIVRLSLGDNTELGGEVTGGYVRWNFFPRATVYVGDELWVEDGKLMREDK